MPYEFKFPDIGEGTVEGEIVKWFVKEGAEVKEGQSLVEVMTDKVNVEIPSPAEGIVLRIMVGEGQIVKVGETLIVIGKPGEKIIETPIETDRAKPSEVKPIQVSSKPTEEKVLATPAVRKLARDMKVDIRMIKGTGSGGRITEEDIRKYATTQVSSIAIEREHVERVPIRGLRRRIAENMVKSLQTSAQVTHIDEADVTELVTLRGNLKEEAAKRGVKLTYLPFIVKALVASLKHYPYLNSSIDEKQSEIILKKYHNIGMATATEQGLVVPNIKNADSKDIYQLATEIESLTSKAKEGKLNLEDIQGGTFTITNVGSIGGLLSTPIVNYPEAAILAVHKIVKKPVVKNGEVRIRDMVYLALSFDHRILDGAMAADFMNTLISYLEKPESPLSL